MNPPSTIHSGPAPHPIRFDARLCSSVQPATNKPMCDTIVTRSIAFSFQLKCSQHVCFRQWTQGEHHITPPPPNRQFIFPLGLLFQPTRHQQRNRQQHILLQPVFTRTSTDASRQIASASLPAYTHMQRTHTHTHSHTHTHAHTSVNDHTQAHASNPPNYKQPQPEIPSDFWVALKGRVEISMNSRLHVEWRTSRHPCHATGRTAQNYCKQEGKGVLVSVLCRQETRGKRKQDGPATLTCRNK